MNQCLMLVMVCALLSGCGKKGPLEPVETSDYPRTYPKPLEQGSFPPLKKQDQKGSYNGL